MNMPRIYPIIAPASVFCFIVLLMLNSAKAGGGKMILSDEALDIAQTAIENHQYFDRPGDIVVELKQKTYLVTFAFLIPGESSKTWADYTIEVFIDGQSGKVLKIEDKGKAGPSNRGLADAGWENFMPGKRAYDIAINALKGFEHHDKTGKLTIELKKGIYYVTFPLIKSADTGSRSADYAFQICIDAQSGKVLKILGSS